MDKRFLAILGVIVVVFVGIIWANNKKAAAPSGGDKNASSSSQATNHVTGANAKHVNLTEYGDYQCPVCGLYYPSVKEVVTKYSNDIQFQFRNFPLTQVHPNAFAGSRAAEAAGMQNKYWEMHDMLYENQQVWSSSPDPLSTYTQFAQQLGLDTTKFTADYKSDKVNNAINADIAAGNKLQISGTPTFYLNGKEIELKSLVDPKTNRPSADLFSKQIDAAIASSNK
jgi:protein-disulfide isomerase